MKKQILFLILGISFFSLVYAIQEPIIYYKLDLDYGYGNIIINSTEIEFSQEKIENYFGFYSAVVLDFNGKTLNLTFFDIPTQIIYDTIDENGTINGGGIINLNETSFEIYLPYYENAKEIVIYDENLVELTRKDINEYSKQREEISEEVVEDKEEQVKSREEIYGTESLIDKLSKYWRILLIILIILIIVLFYSLNKKWMFFESQSLKILFMFLGYE